MTVDHASSEGLAQFFADPPECSLYRPVLRGQRSGLKTSSAGVYVWYADSVLASQSCLPIPRQGAWDLGERLIMYVGESHTRTVCKRLKAESKLRADQSQPQMGFGCLLRHTLGLELRRLKTTPQYVDFVAGKHRLFDWMQSHARFAFVEIPDGLAAVETQYDLIDSLRPLFNLSRRLDRSHPFEPVYRELKDELRRRASALPPV